jgi:hypothetical protein
LIAHGPLMTGGFLGTLIGVERAAASGSRWAYAAPGLTAAAAAALGLWVLSPVAPLLLIVGSALVAVLTAAQWRRWRSLGLLTMTLGAAMWTVGNAWWLWRGHVSGAAWWWLAFLVFTIAGERLELSRLLAPTPAVRRAFLAGIGIVLAGVALTPRWAELGVRTIGVGLIGLAAWLVRYDMARRALGRPGQTRFIALCLLGGYLWLAVGGVLAAATGAAMPGPLRDAVLHAAFLGFALSMVFGHAPVVFPALVGRPIPYRWSFYIPLVLLHASLAGRLAGDLVDVLGRWRVWGGLANAVALVLFVGTTAWAIRRG